MRPLRSPPCRALVLAMLTALLPLALGACGGDGGGGGGGGRADVEPAETTRARAVLLANDLKEAEALALLRPLADRPDAEVQDLVRCAILALGLSRLDEARADTERARALAPDDPKVLYLLGHLAVRDLDFAGAAALYERVRAMDPDDLPVKMLLASALYDAGREDEAAVLWREVVDAGLARGRGMYKQAVYRLRSRALYAGDMDEVARLQAEFDRCEALGVKSADAPEIERQGYGLLALPARTSPPPAAARDAGAAGDFLAGAPIDLGGATRLLAVDLDRDGRGDLVGYGPAGLVVAMQDAQGAWHPVRVHDRPVLDVAAVDLDAGDRVDTQTLEAQRPALRALVHPPRELACVEGRPGEDGGTVLVLGLDAASGAWSPLGPEGIQPGGARQVVPSDVDHDGWVDLVVPGRSGLRVMRNDGTTRSPQPLFPDASPEAGLGLGPCLAVLPEDVDADGDTDYFVATEAGLRLLLNERGGRFSEAGAAWHLPAVALAPDVDPRDALDALDLDEDGRPDLVLVTAQGLVWARNTGASFADLAVLDPRPLPGAWTDVDLDGHVDRVSCGPDGVTWRRGPLAPSGVAAKLANGSAVPLVPPCAGDLDGDGDLEIAALVADGARVLSRSGPPPAAAVPIELLGTKDGADGLGAVVELRAGAIYRRVFWRGGVPVLGLGRQTEVDVVTVIWPNGVLSGAQDAPAGVRLVLEQPKRMVGSCPFLYTWDGERFTFVTDVLGTTPLGLPMAPGMFVPFDHEEYVKVRGDQLVPKDGVLELRITEELREVTYLDRLRLHAIDHPADVEIQPNEGFVFPPFPPHHVHTFRDVRAPARVVDGEGRDWTERVAAVDGRHAQAFHPLPYVFMGLAEPWALEIDLAADDAARAAIAAAPRLRLALTGWMQWTDASVNVAASRHPDVAFEPPMLWVPDGDGWRPAGPPIGFPAGKTKTLVVDVTDVVDRADPRLRITTTLQLSWDAIRLVLDADDAPYVDTLLEAAGAELAFRGFSAFEPDPTGEQAERFDFDRLQGARWDQHPGRYTRYGEVLPLLGAVDDMYVILGAGDCLAARFDASALPPLPEGWTRDWLVYFDGWAKDRDPNTAAAERVEPLPFHGMSAYPPPAGETFPWTEERLAWDREWNTREGAVLRPRLSDPGPVTSLLPLLDDLSACTEHEPPHRPPHDAAGGGAGGSR